MNWKGKYFQWLVGNSIESTFITCVVFIPIIIGAIVGSILGTPLVIIYLLFSRKDGT